MEALKLAIPNKAGVDEFELEYNGLITHDLYYSEFNRDLTMDTLHCINIYGGLSRSVALRIVWAMAKTHNANFAPFLEFLNSLEDTIVSFRKDWGEELANFIIPKLEEML